MAANLVKLGFEPTGFDMAVVSDVPGGGGLSSSAAFEAAAGRAMEALWKGGSEVSAVKLAQMSQNTENVYFGKPCGLMDQLAVCLGGLAFMNFEDSTEPKAEKLDLNFEDYGYALCLVDVGCDHVAFTDEYANSVGVSRMDAAVPGILALCVISTALSGQGIATGFDRSTP